MFYNGQVLHDKPLFTCPFGFRFPHHSITSDIHIFCLICIYFPPRSKIYGNSIFYIKTSCLISLYFQFSQGQFKLLRENFVECRRITFAYKTTFANKSVKSFNWELMPLDIVLICFVFAPTFVDCSLVD
ncbi:hypothetical protein S245_043859 [Arachis hypogaea]